LNGAAGVNQRSALTSRQRGSTVVAAIAVVWCLGGCSTQTTRAGSGPATEAAKVPGDLAVYLSPELSSFTLTAGDWANDAQTSSHPVEVNVGKLVKDLFERRLPEAIHGAYFIKAVEEAPGGSLIMVPSILQVEAHRLERKSDGEVVATVDLRVTLRTRSGDELFAVSRSSSGSFDPKKGANPLLNLLRLPVLAADLALVIPEVAMGAKGPVGDTALFVRREYSEAVLVAASGAVDGVLSDFRSTPKVRLALERQQALLEDTVGLDARLDRLVGALLAGRDTGVIAVTEFVASNGKSGGIERFLTGEVRVRVRKRPRLTLVDPELAAKVLKELRLRPHDLVDPGVSREFGKLSSADIIMVGNTTDLGVRVRLDSRLLDADTGKVIGTASETVVKDERLSALEGTGN
jgi:hypothetical protein